MNQNVQMSLQLAVLGMGLVILALLIIAAVIMLLARVFKSKPLVAESDEPAAETAALGSPDPLLSSSASSLADEAAAIAVAFVLQRARKRPTMGGFRRQVDYTDVELIGEVVNVVGIDQGTGAWANAGRLQSIK